MANTLLVYRDGDRTYPWLWFLRAVGLVFTIITLGLTASSAADFSNAGCSSPPKLSYNIAVSVLSFAGLVYLLLSTGPTRPLTILPWVIFGQLALDAVLFIFWLAAASTSNYTCDDICAACGGLFCDCFFFYKDKRTTSANPANILLSKRRGHGGGGGFHSSGDSSSGGTGDAIISFDSLLTVLFAVCFAASVLWFTQERKAARLRSSQGATTTAPAPGVGEPRKHEEAGIAPAQYPQPGNPNVPYQQQQPTMHQVPYNPTAPQQEHYQSPPVSNFSTPPPPNGTAEMPHLASGHPGAPIHGQTPG